MSLGLWPMYRLSIVLLSHVLISAESGLAQKALSEVESVWSQVLESGDEETICLAALAMGKANVELGLDKHSEVLLSKARHDVETALIAARKLESTSLIQQCLTILSLLADLAVSDDRDDLAEEWASSYRKDQTDFKGDLQTIGEIVKLVGVRVIEGWNV
ncbi:hypothetical protein TREMEDRAFT_57036, partial [Tremella mesenterica DSM 1558]|uniref:uncharacterized protein n=1 Tax=Tremella mesenterica (strain ATCC 24925 / CBS 8224 / DSM 1558 / NBRC 9311 / NRRL Y-6157 / RJB 2259-6 / UBC 559-6) TaxID=578456 RepID=UPI0003F48E99